MYDLIGDIHGHADELTQLLDSMGYRLNRGVYEHPERKVIFLGDFIDRGPQIRQVLDVVRPMVEGGKALAVMGNHEFNALAFHTKHMEREDAFLRTRDNKNIRQHGQTYRTHALTDKLDFDDELMPEVIKAAVPYPPDAKPLFVGHYWLSGDHTELLAANIACVDYSVAKGGFLCAYRWQGEQTLDKGQFFWVGRAMKSSN